MCVALFTLFGAQRHSHDIPDGPPGRTPGAGPVTPEADAPEDHRKFAASILSRHAKAPGSMWDLGNTALPCREAYPSVSQNTMSHIQIMRT
jgi:hypothetical protein